MVIPQLVLEIFKNKIGPLSKNHPVYFEINIPLDICYIVLIHCTVSFKPNSITWSTLCFACIYSFMWNKRYHQVDLIPWSCHFQLSCPNIAILLDMLVPYIWISLLSWHSWKKIARCKALGPHVGGKCLWMNRKCHYWIG